MLKSLQERGMKMIKIGTQKDLHKIRHLPVLVQVEISKDIKTLDEIYGANRDIDADMGGFVVVCDKGEKLNIPNFDRKVDIPEYTDSFPPYKKFLYISGTERNIVIYEKE